MKRYSDLFFTSKNVIKKNSLLAGEWCLDGQANFFNKKNIVDRENHRNIPREGIICKKLYDRLLDDLINNLQKIYNVNWSKKSWEIFLGPWLIRYVSIIYDRYELIKYITAKYDFKKIHLTKDEKFNLVEQDAIAFRFKSQNEEWNLKLFSKIYLRYFKNKNTKKIFSKTYISKKEFGINTRIKLNYLSIFFKKIINFLIYYFKKYFNLVFYKTYLNNKKLILHILLKKKKLYFPYDFNFTIPPIQKLSNLRNTTIKSRHKLSNVEKILRDLLYEMLPFYYLELIGNLKYLNKNLILPPEYKSNIYTATAIWHDGIFKFWLANALSKNSKLNYFQHGCNYGVTKFSYAENMEVDLSNRFFSWGWKSPSKKIKKFYCIKTLFLKKYSRNLNNKILIVLGNPHNFTSYHSTGMICTKRTYIYYEIIINICKKIKSKNFFFLRLPPNDNKNFNFKYKLRNFKDNLNFQKGDNNFLESVKDYSLIVHTVDSTCFLETMSLDKPSILILPKRLYKSFFYRKTSLKYYKKLEKANILFNSESEFFNFIEKKNFNINEWWNDKKTIKAKQFFCNRYCRISDKPLDEILKII